MSTPTPSAASNSAAILGTEAHPMNPDQASAFAEAVTGMGRTPYLVGPPGIGKTDCVHQMGARLNMPVVVRMLAQFDPSDFVGLPHIFNDAAGRARTKFAIPESFTFDQPVILFLDEFAQADIAVQRAASEIILNHTFGGIPLAKGTRVVAASNRKQDRAGVSEVLGHNKSRMMTVHVGVDPTQWTGRAALDGIDPSIISYITTKGAALLNVDHKSYSYPSPRTWAMVSDALKCVRSDPAQRSLLPAMVAGAIGCSEAASFLQYMETFEERPSLADILKSPQSAKIPKKHPDQVQVAHMVLSNLEASSTTNGGFDASCEYLARLARESVHAALKKANNEAIGRGNSSHSQLIIKAKNHIDTL